MEQEERVSFANKQGQILKGIIHRPVGNKGFSAVILCHGMESNKESEKLVALSRKLAHTGISALRFDFSYSGESGGSFEDITYSGEVEDLEAAFHFMLQRQAKKIAILGSSMGGTVALLFAARETRVANLVTIAAPVHPEKIAAKLLAQEEVQRWHQLRFFIYHGRRINASLLDDLKKVNVPEAAKQISCPVLIIHGDADDTVPVDEAYELHSLLRSPKKICILQGGDHRLSNTSHVEKALKESVDWVVQHL